MSPEEFKKKFKPGDVITGNTHYKGRPLFITAIGMKRFLFICVVSNRRESVSMIDTAGNEWRKWDENEWPDCQYVYAMKRIKELWDLI